MTVGIEVAFVIQKFGSLGHGKSSNQEVSVRFITQFLFSVFFYIGNFFFFFRLTLKLRNVMLYKLIQYQVFKISHKRKYIILLLTKLEWFYVICEFDYLRQILILQAVRSHMPRNYFWQ